MAQLLHAIAIPGILRDPPFRQVFPMDANPKLAILRKKKMDTQMTKVLTDNKAFADARGIDLQTVLPPEKPERLKLLAEILARTDVPYVISDVVGKKYFELAQSGVPFSIGTLSDQTVDLGGFENEQVYESLTFDDHLSWACLVADQQSTKHQFACREYLHGEKLFAIGGNIIPDYYILNARIYQQTGWQLATVSEIIPAHVFFHCHSHKFFPVTTFMRPVGTDYLEEPDIGHDIAGHVATFTIPQVAEVMNNHGLANDIIHREKQEKLDRATTQEEIDRINAEATELLLYAGRLYWFTVEFGLVQQEGELKAFGAGILSSPGETQYSVDSPHSNRVLIDPESDRDLLRLATTDYLISEFQKTYFVLKEFASLSRLTPDRIVSIVKSAKRLPHYTWREIVPGDKVLNVGMDQTSPNEKYYRLLADQELDDCLRRAAVRNLRMISVGLELKSSLERSYFERVPEIPNAILERFRKADANGEFDEYV